MAATPKGAWQQPHPTLRICQRHPGQGAGGDPSMCAYRQGDPDRCDYCHAPWVFITAQRQDASTREAHLEEHRRADAVQAKKAAALRNRRAAAQQAVQATNTPTPVRQVPPAAQRTLGAHQ